MEALPYSALAPLLPLRPLALRTEARRSSPLKGPAHHSHCSAPACTLGVWGTRYLIRANSTFRVFITHLYKVCRLQHLSTPQDQKVQAKALTCSGLRGPPKEGLLIPVT